ncbi:MAG: hypothetical protein QOE93_615 [Actinomycetota bacterium]|jgi:diguanylate cyclase (GGDEF)-like protein|nr:hypothetical protein [Actinomycetota bacterium]
MGVPVTVPDLRLDQRFPNFGPKALAAGLVAVFTFPLRKGNDQLGALDLYRDTPGPLSDDAMAAAQTLADVAAAYLLNAQARADLLESSHLSRESSLHDALTGLPNRLLLLERLEHALLRARRTGNMAAVLFADLDQFKAVNDQYGHRVGDELLVAVAERLTGQLRTGDTLARLSGDEFVILCEDLAAMGEVDAIAGRIRVALAKPFVLSVGEVDTSASIGIAFAGPADDVPEELLHSADVAMYQAKRKGGDRQQIIELREQRRVDDRASLQRDLGRALARGELRLAYQPIVGTVSQRIVGAEALVRWTHPSRGEISPATLIPLAEQGGHIAEIGRWVLDQACRDRHRWRGRSRKDDIAISVNVSAHQLMGPDFITTVEEVLRDTHTDPAQLTLEVPVDVSRSTRASWPISGRTRPAMRSWPRSSVWPTPSG